MGKRTAIPVKVYMPDIGRVIVWFTTKQYEKFNKLYPEKKLKKTK